jgi:hypothetical protein
LDIRNSKGNKPRTAHKMQESKFGKKSELLEKERNLDTSDVRDLISTFWELSSIRKQSTGRMCPLDPLVLKAHMELSGLVITKWEYKVLMSMDYTLRSALIDKEEK